MTERGKGPEWNGGGGGGGAAGQEKQEELAAEKKCDEYIYVCRIRESPVPLLGQQGGVEWVG